MFQHSSDFEMKKVGPLVEKNFSGFYNGISRFEGNKLRKSGLFFEKVFFFSVSF